ncbi:DUF5801 repeats-in-toxin domain-containing protein [Tsuneonella mangrovi]|uniref:DUF5801 repeats-in-toxin domain-containing protein n=1 Tax=Tsuneonella mangrovi TaxID=1982042 RepID=UPI0014708E02|nr:DUF5801 repeats-in-toxin domain-containing protein [Tsuneonella mangrovi]
MDFDNHDRGQFHGDDASHGAHSDQSTHANPKTHNPALPQADAHLQANGAADASVGQGASQVLTADANNVIILPAGVELDAIHVEGRDLVIVADDGTHYVIPDGAIIVPQLVVDGVSVPPLNLAALLIGQEPQPAAGAPQSSGGDFAAPVGDIQAAYGLGNLLPYTELQFPQYQREEILPNVQNKLPGVIVITPDQPAGAQSATSTVYEAGLGAPHSPPGTDAAANSETTVGTIDYTSPDGLGSISLNGVDITQVGQTFTGQYGTLTITSIAPGAIGYSYTLTDNTLGQSMGDMFDVVVTDTNGDQAAASLTISIVDDGPVANPDTDHVAAGTYGPETGNVMTGAGTTSGAAGADQQGADGAKVSGADGFGGDGVVQGNGSIVVTGEYGTLTIDPNGHYSYVRAAGGPGGVTDTFHYTLTDADGSTASSTLTIDIGDSPASVVSVPLVGPGTIVDEAGLPARPGGSPGSSTGDGSNITTGTIQVTAPDGIASVEINHIVVTGAGQQINTPDGYLTIVDYNPTTGQIDYQFTLTTNTSGDNTSVSFDVKVTDTDGDSDQKPFVIHIIDDHPTAVDDPLVSVAEDASGTVGGNVMTNDTQGADGAKVVSVNIDGVDHVVDPSTGVTVATPEGTYTINADGTWTFDPNPGQNQSNGPIDAGFHYTIQDGDGDQSTATQPINITDGANPIGPALQSVVVDDQNLADGSTPSATQPPSASATLAFTAGSDPITSIVFGDTSGLNGNLTWTRVNDTTIEGHDGSRLVVTLTLQVSGDTATVVTTLNDNYLHPAGGGDQTTAIGTATVVATDLDGDTATGSVAVGVSDDLPTLAVGTPVADSVQVDETHLGTSSGLIDFSGLFTPDYHADSNGTIGNYQLGISADGADTGLVDTATGQAVVLHMVGGVVEGVTAGSGDVVFTLTVDASGSVELTQLRAIVHGDTSSYNEASPALDPSLITLSATATDGDGDSVTNSAHIGGAISFLDDGPTVQVGLVDNEFATMVTHDHLTIGAAFDTASANYAGAFDTVAAGTSGGADGLASSAWSYALALDVTNGSATTLTSDGHVIYLWLSGGTVIGSTSSTDPTDTSAQVFDLTVDSTGTVTLHQYAQLDHPLPGDTSNYQFQTIGLPSGLVSLVGTDTVTDGDGDTASSSAHFDLAPYVQFADDGPSSSDYAGGSYVEGSGSHDIGDAVTLLHISAGADGLQGTLQGIVFTNQGTTGGTLSIDGSGELIYTAPADVTNPGGAPVSETFSYTVTDGDGDSVTHTVTFDVTDTGVTNLSASNVSVDEDDISGANGNPGGPGDLTTPVPDGPERGELDRVRGQPELRRARDGDRRRWLDRQHQLHRHHQRR